MQKFSFLLAVLWVSCVVGQVTDSPQGFYYKTGGNGPDQWFQILAVDEDSYAVTDIYGEGFNTTFNDGLAQISSNGLITVAATNNDTSYVLNRTVGTNASFPLNTDRSFTPNPLFSGAWNISELLLDPVSGEVLPQFDGSFEFIDVFILSAQDQALRFNDSNNVYFQGTMIGADEVLFRYLRNPYADKPTTGPYATTPGSTNNFSRDNIGYGKFTDVNHFEVLLGIQAFTPDTLTQFLLKISGTRVNPLDSGDANGDGSTNQTDRDLIAAAIGQVKNQDESFSIASDLNNDGLIDSRDLASFDDTTLPTKNVTAAMTALWYDPSHDGAGWDLQILNDQLAHLSWYTYDAQGNQMWITGLGTIDGNEISFPTMRNVSQGTVFGNAFDHEQIELVDWGSVHLFFVSCDSAQITYSSRQGFGHGGLQPSRINNHSGLDCVNNSITPAEINRFTGIWYDPTHDGEGWIIQVNADSTALLTWYTYDENAQPMWMIGVGTVNENTLSIAELTVTQGAQFGPDFNPADVQRTPWGGLTFTLNGCHQGSLEYNALNPALGSGTLQPVRLASTSALSCID